MTDVRITEPERRASVQDQSISTDSEESFLIKQLNKSQLFNNSSSSGSGSSKQRRSFFRESYIDEEGTMRPFSVYHDVINETSDESRDISLTGLSTFNLENAVGNTTNASAGHPLQQNVTTQSNVLSEIDRNRSVLGHRKSASVSRSDSIKDQEAKHTQKRMSGSSFRLSAYAALPPSAGSNHTHSNSKSSSYYSNSSGRGREGSYLDALNTQDPRVRGISPTPEFPLPRTPKYHSFQADRVPTPEYPAPPPPATDANGNPIHQCLYDTHEITLEALTGLAQIAATQKSSSSNSHSSYKSARPYTRESIMNFEETRRRTRGTPHLLIQNPGPARDRVRFRDNEDKFHGTPVAEKVEEPGVTPSIHSPSSEEFLPDADDMSIRQSKRARMFSGQSVVKKPAGLKEFKLRPPSKKADDASPRFPYFHKGRDEESYPSDTLLEKIKYERVHRPDLPQRDTQKLAMLVYFISFLLPPLFFFLGLGVLDPHIGNVNVGLKRLSLLTGVVVMMIVFAMIGVGFGVGITTA